MPKKILILFAHPTFEHSIINAALRHAVENLDGVTFHDLYAAYPDFKIDVPKEQQLCMSHDVLIMQHPFYWYSTPAILKEWQDQVLQYNWAYGPNGKCLKGKHFLQAITSGGGPEAYRAGGSNRFSIEEFTRPLQGMANLCKMKWLPPFAVMGIRRDALPQVTNQYTQKYQQLILALKEGDTNKISRFTQ